MDTDESAAQNVLLALQGGLVGAEGSEDAALCFVFSLQPSDATLAAASDMLKARFRSRSAQLATEADRRGADSKLDFLASAEPRPESLASELRVLDRVRAVMSHPSVMNADLRTWERGYF